jgi:hypothetical protein
METKRMYRRREPGFRSRPYGYGPLITHPGRDIRRDHFIKSCLLTAYLYFAWLMALNIGDT